jgi:hypothetical protein
MGLWRRIRKDRISGGEGCGLNVIYAPRFYDREGAQLIQKVVKVFPGSQSLKKFLEDDS